MRRYAKLYIFFLMQRLKILLAHPANLLLGMLAQIAIQIAGVLAVWVVMSQVPDLNGWSLAEVLLIYGLMTVARSLSLMFSSGLLLIGPDFIRNGRFDCFLTRPIDPLFHLLADRFNHEGLGEFALGAVLVIQASQSLGIDWTPLKLAVLVVGVLSGGLIFIAINLITAVSAFWIINSFRLTWAVSEPHYFAKYPLTIYPRTVGIVLTWLLPFALASYYPASYILDRDSGSLAWVGLPVAAGLLFLGYRLWQFGLRHYTSTGS